MTRQSVRVAPPRPTVAGVHRQGPLPLERLVWAGLTRPDRDTGDGDLLDAHLHSDGDEVCPRCLGWIDGRDFVRRTAYGVLQHEVCAAGDVAGRRG